MVPPSPRVKEDSVSETSWKSTHRSEHLGPRKRATPKRPGICQSALAAKLSAARRLALWISFVVKSADIFDESTSQGSLSPAVLGLVQRHLFAVEKHAMPHFQSNERKNLFGVDAAIAVGVDKLLDSSLLEVTPLDCFSVGQNVANLVFKIRP